jgi:heme exporter protein CcmD
MTSWHEFVTMGRFGFYVWPAFGFGLVVMLLNIYWAHLREKAAHREVRESRSTEEESRS